MSSPEFPKCGCRHCGGHIEFPAAAAGQTVACPHCGQPTVLAAADLPPGRGGSGRRRWVTGLAMVLLVAALVAAFVWGRRSTPPLALTEKSALAVSSNVPPVASPAPPATPPPGEITNGFAILPYELEKTAGSSLVYVVGTVRNTSDRQRFGVKIEFGLFDTNNDRVGSATDYQSVLDPHADWHFKAMVMVSKTVSPRFRSIAEEQ